MKQKMTFQKISETCVMFSDIIRYLLTCCVHVVHVVQVTSLCKTSELFAQSLHTVQINQIFFVQNRVRVKLKNPCTETSEDIEQVLYSAMDGRLCQNKDHGDIVPKNPRDMYLCSLQIN